MAEKEKITRNNRIINAEKYKRRIKKGRIYIDVRDKKFNCLLSKIYTRQEAIERMAKAICKETNYQCSVCDFGDNKEKCEAWIYFQYEASAKAALNALLEV